MKRNIKRAIKLPDVKDKRISYALHSVDIAKKGCYNEDKKLLIDEGYGDYNMKLFRMKDRKKYITSIPTAFTPTIH
jgi:hypothetical protein